MHFDGNNEEESIHGNINKQSIFDIKKYQMYNQYWQESFHKKNHKRAKLAILGSGCYFGEEEFLANKLRVTKAVVKMKSVIYIIKNEVFLLVFYHFMFYIRRIFLKFLHFILYLFILY